METDRRPLKVLHIDSEELWGGGENQVLGLVDYLSFRGHTNHLLCHPGGVLSRAVRQKGFATFPLRMRNDLDLRPMLRLRRLMRQEAYDIVHFHTKRAHALVLGLARVHGGPGYVVTRRMDYPVRRGWYSRCLYDKKVDGVVAISRKIADVLVAGGVGRERIRVIYSGIDPTPFQRSQRTEQNIAPMVIGTVAVLEERKGHRFLLEAASLLKRQGFRLKFRFAGDGSRKESLQKLVSRLGLREEVEFMGFVSDIPSFLSLTDIVVLPSLYEGLGVAVLEAMAARKPVVATQVGGLPELIEDQITGLLVPPKDPNALAQAISGLINQRGSIQQMGDEAWKRIQQDFTVEQMAKKNEGYYYDILAGRSDRELREMEGKNIAVEKD